MSLLTVRIACISIILLINSCSATQNNSGDKKMDNKNIEIVLSMILDHPDFEKYIHPEVKGRIPLRIITTKNIGVNFSINKFGKPVVFYDSSPQEDDIPLIMIESFEIENNKIKFKMFYEIEGVIIEGSVTNENNKWTISDFSSIES